MGRLTAKFADWEADRENRWKQTGKSQLIIGIRGEKAALGFGGFRPLTDTEIDRKMTIGICVANPNR